MFPLVKIGNEGLSVGLVEIPEPKCTQRSACPIEPKYVLHNGEETDYYCEECFKEALLDYVKSNRHVSFTETGENEWTM